MTADHRTANDLPSGVLELRYHSVPAIFDALKFFRVEHLQIDPAEFERIIRAYISNDIAIDEACPQGVLLKCTMMSFTWGHDHDFGSFNVPGLMGTRHVWMLSRNRFDIVFCLGVIYHLTDPLVALRRLFHVLKPEGLLCIESMSIAESEPFLEFQGRSSVKGRGKWNWLAPSPKALALMLEDSGFEVVGVGDGLVPFRVTQEGDPMGPNRCFAVAKKVPGHKIYRAGQSMEID